MAEREKQELRTAFFIPTISFDLIRYVADGIERYLNGDAPPNGTGKCRTGLPRDCRNLCSLQFHCLRDLAGDLVIHRLILFVCGRKPSGELRASRRSCRGSSNWAGSTAATRGSTRARPQAIPTTLVNSRQNSSRMAADVILTLAASRWGRCCRRPAPCRLCSCMSPIRLAPAPSLAWRGRAAMPPVSACSNTPRAANGWNLVRAEVIPVNMLDAAEIERSVTAFARGANGGLVLTASGSAFVHHDLIIALARRPAGAGAD